MSVASAALIAGGISAPVPPGVALAQPAAPAPSGQPAPAATPQPVATQDDQGNLTQAQLEQLLAPIALYPDDLLMQMLMAATYPLEIVQAKRWLGDGQNVQLHGEALAKALTKEAWDPSVKSLLPFPDVLTMMNDQLDWTQQLGDAVLAQQGDVIIAVQVLRRRAQASGALKSGPQQTVTVAQSVNVAPSQGSASAQGAPVAQPPKVITIAPTNPAQVYVPAYNPSVVYGAWPYPSYPPVYYPPPAGAQIGSALLTGMAFAGGVAVVNSLWGWARPGWGRGDIDVNVSRFNNINVNRPQISNNHWQHDVAHRHGVAYRNDRVRPGGGPGRVQAREQFRGRVNHAGQGQGIGGGGRPGSHRPEAGRGRTNLAGHRAQGGGPGHGAPRPGTAQRPGTQHAGGQRPGGNQRQAIQHQRSGRPQIHAPAPKRGPSGLQGVGQGSRERAAAQRGQMSRQGQPAARARAHQRAAAHGGSLRHGGRGH